jgi:hypothetical protein
MDLPRFGSTDRCAKCDLERRNPDYDGEEGPALRATFAIRYCGGQDHSCRVRPAAFGDPEHIDVECPRCGFWFAERCAEIVAG